MDKKIKEVVDKYYKTKCYAVLEKHFKDNYSIDSWVELKNQLDKGYISIVNQQCWTKDFLWGGTDQIYLTQLFLEPPTHEVKLNYFCRRGEIQLGDAISMLYMCNSMGIPEVHIMDLIAFIYIIATMQVCGDAIALRNEKKWYVAELPKRIAYLTRMFVALMTNHEDLLETNFVIHSMSFFETIAQMEHFAKIVFGHNRHTKKLKERISVNVPYCRYENYITCVSSLIGASQFNMQLNEQMKRPYITYHEPYVTAFERYMLDNKNLGKNYRDRVKTIQTVGIPRAIDIMRKKQKKAENEIMAQIIAEANPEQERYIPQATVPVSDAYDKLWAVRTMVNRDPNYRSKIIEEPIFSRDYLSPPSHAIATTIVDLNKMAFDNATKDTEWLINTALAAYSNAQEINAVHVSFQTRGTDLALLTIIINDNDEIQQELERKISSINTVLKSNYMHNYTYKFTRDGKCR